MKVQFEDEPKLYDRLLGPVLAASRSYPLQAQARALARKGYSNALDSNGVHQWIRQNGRGPTVRSRGDAARSPQVSDGIAAPPGSGSTVRGSSTLSDWVQQGRRWSKLWEEVGAEGLRSTLRSRRDVHLFIAGKVFSVLLSPLPVEKAVLPRNVNAKAAYTLIALRIMRQSDFASADGSRTTPTSTRMSYAWLAAHLGCSLRKAQMVIDDLAWMGFLEHSPGSSFRVGRFQIPLYYPAREGRKKPLPVPELSPEEHAAIVPFTDSIEAFVDSVADPLADVISSVDHPLWNGSDVFSHRHWLKYVLDVAGVPVLTMGLRLGKARTEVLGAMKAEHMNLATAPLLQRNLDRLADDPEFGRKGRGTARQVSTAAIRAWKEGAVTHRAQAREHREIKNAGYARLDALLEFHPLPQASKRRDDGDDLRQQLRLWMRSCRDSVATDPFDDRFVATAGMTLHRRITAAGFNSEFADAAVLSILGTAS